MKSIYALLLLSLSGCMVTAPTYNTAETRVFVVDNVTPVYPSVVRPYTPPPRPVVPKPPKRRVPAATPAGKACDKFVLPAAAPMPARPDLNDPRIGVDVKIEDVVAKYAGELKVYIKHERETIEAARVEHLKSCTP